MRTVTPPPSAASPAGRTPAMALSRRVVAILLSVLTILLGGSLPALASSGQLRPLLGKRARALTGAVSKAKHINPCMTPDPGFGIYDHWTRNISMGQMLAPQRGGITSRGKFDLIVHFHGHYPVRKEFVKTAKGIVLVAIDLGTGSGAYSRAFASPAAFTKLIKSVEEEMARRSGRKKTKVRKLGLSSWSAGYGAVAQILSQPIAKKVDALILLDSAHAGYVSGKTLKTAQIEPFLKYARRASRRQRFMFQSYSSIIPPGYASTREVAHYMVKKLGGKIKKARPRHDPLGLELFERYDRGFYHLRGYRGDDKPDHCAHLGLMRDIIRVHINRRWKSPKGRKGKRRAHKKKPVIKGGGNIHVVRSGQTLSGIARKYGLTTKELREANGIKRHKPIRIGQELVIPGATAKPTKKTTNKKTTKTSTSKKLSRGEQEYKVRRGDALTRIAKRHGVTLKALRARNGLKRGGKPIRPGQKLIIPAK